MGGRGSGGSHNAGGKLSKNIGAGITDRNELVNLYNSISGNPSYTAEERVRAMSSIKEQIDKLDAKKAEDLKQKRLDALAKARAKRAENIKNGVKTEKKPRQTKAKMSMDSTVYDLKSQLIRNVQTDGYIRSSDFRVEDYGNVISVQVRDLGKWKNPSHARYEEDYDWQVLHKSSGKQIDKVVKKCQRHQVEKSLGQLKKRIGFHSISRKRKETNLWVVEVQEVVEVVVASAKITI